MLIFLDTLLYVQLLSGPFQSLFPRSEFIFYRRQIDNCQCITFPHAQTHILMLSPKTVDIRIVQLTWQKDTLPGSINAVTILGPCPDEACAWLIHEGMYEPAYPASANELRDDRINGSFSPNLFSAGRIGPPYFDASS